MDRKNVVVPADRLKAKFKNFWYRNPLNPFQELSNTFILGMAEYRMQFESSIRSCELWCRKMQMERIEHLMAFAQPSGVKMEYILQGKKCRGMLQIMKQRYPEDTQLLSSHEEGQSTPPLGYDSLCKLEEGVEEAHVLAKESVKKCEERISLGRGVKGERLNYGSSRSNSVLLLYSDTRSYLLLRIGLDLKPKYLQIPVKMH